MALKKTAVKIKDGNKKSTHTKNRELTDANTVLRKSNDRLESSNKKITQKGIKEKATLTRSIQSGKDLTIKLAQSVERGSKNAKTAKAKLTRSIQSGKDLTLKLAQSVERGSNDAKTANETLTRSIQSGKDLTIKLAQSVERGSKNAKTAKAKLTRHIQSGKDLTLKLAQSVERGSNDAKTANETLTRSIQSGKDLTVKLAQSVKRGSKNAKTAKAKLNRKDAELIMLNKELLTFTYISSHDLQEPLRNLQIIASMILEKEERNLSEQGKDYFKRMQNAAMRIQKLIQDLIEYSNTNKVHFLSESTDLNKLVKEVKIDLKEMLKESKTRIVASNLDTLMVSSFQFRKLFKELITNSIKFSKENIIPKITIRSEIIKGAITGVKNFPLRKKYCHISVTDNGLGFDRLFRKRIFEVFQKLHGRQYKGSGIGLATCRKIVEHHGGIISATSEPGKGSTFDIYIPL